MNYKSFLSVFIFSTVFIFFFSACNKKVEEENKENETDTPVKVISDTIENKTGFIVEYLKNGNDEFLIVDTIQIANSIDFINTVKDSLILQLDKNAGIVFQTFSFDSTGNFNFNQQLDYPAFIALVSSKDMERFKNIPFVFEVKNSIIIFIKEIYIP